MSVQAGDYNSSQAVVGLPWVDAGDAAQSYLFHKISGTQASVGGSGAQMPQGGSAMSSTDLQLIEDWINAGANE